MSKYLCVGLAKEIVVAVRNEEMAKEVETDFFKTVDKNLYNVKYNSNEDELTSYVMFSLKDDMLAEYAMDLMIEQHQKYIKSMYSAKAIEYYKKIKSKDKKEIIRLINTENSADLFTFNLGWFGFTAGCFFEKPVKAYITEFTTFHCSEKTYMEEYNDFFRYMRNVLVNSTDNPLRTALAVSL